MIEHFQISKLELVLNWKLFILESKKEIIRNLLEILKKKNSNFVVAEYFNLLAKLK